MSEKTKIPLLDRLRILIKGKAPMWRLVPTKTHPYAENPFIASSMTADRLHNILSQAEQGDCGDLFDLYRDVLVADSHIQAEFTKRKIRLLCEQISVLPIDEKNSDDVRAADAARNMIESLPDKISILSFLLDSCLYPVSVVEKIFKPSRKSGLSYEIDRIIPVPHRLLDFRSGDVRIFKTDENGNKQFESFAADSNNFIIHRNHILSSPDYWGGPMRALLFWWLISAMDITWWAQWLERYGLPFLIGKYESNDDESRYVLQQAFATATRVGGIVATKETEIDFINALTAQNGDAFEKLIQTCHREESKLILGQTLSAEAQPTGLGSGVAKSQENVRSDIALFDMMCVATTLKEQLVKPFLEFNGFPGATPTVVIGGESESDLSGIAAILSALSQSGLRIGDDGLSTLSKRCGFPIERSLLTEPKLFSAKVPKTKNDRILSAETIAEKGAAELAPQLRQSGAAILRILQESDSPESFEKAIETYCAKWPAEHITQIIQDCLIANIINGTEKQ